MKPTVTFDITYHGVIIKVKLFGEVTGKRLDDERKIAHYRAEQLS